jgi:hypothetical protein
MARAGLLLILVPFSVVAALMAFLITYGEMQHHYCGKREPDTRGDQGGGLCAHYFLGVVLGGDCRRPSTCLAGMAVGSVKYLKRRNPFRGLGEPRDRDPASFQSKRSSPA